MKIDGRLLRQFVSFASVGALATLIQYLLLAAGVEWFDMNAVAASSAAFVLSSIFNYYCNHRFTFVSSTRHRVAAVRFAAVAGVGLILNAVAMALLTHRFGLAYLVAQLVATALVLVWNFAGNAAWTFAGHRTAGDAVLGGEQK